jgi:hypothetical protein
MLGLMLFEIGCLIRCENSELLYLVAVKNQFLQAIYSQERVMIKK